MELTDADRDILISLGIDPEKLAMLDEELGQAREMQRSSADPVIKAGRVVVANPFGAIGAAVNRGRGAKEVGRIKDEQQAILAECIRSVFLAADGARAGWSERAGTQR